MRIYIAASYRRFPEVNTFAALLRAAGHDVVSRWHAHGDMALDTAIVGPHAQAGDGLDHALRDLEDIQRCECLVLLADPPGSHSRWGRHVEFGYALGLGEKRLVVIGQREVIFHNLYQVEVYESVEKFLYAHAPLGQEDDH